MFELLLTVLSLFLRLLFSLAMFIILILLCTALYQFKKYGIKTSKEKFLFYVTYLNISMLLLYVIWVIGAYFFIITP